MKNGHDDFSVAIRRADGGVVADDARVYGLPASWWGETSSGWGAFVWCATHHEDFRRDDDEEQARLDAFWEAIAPLCGIYAPTPAPLDDRRDAWEHVATNLAALPWFDHEVVIIDIDEEES